MNPDFLFALYVFCSNYHSGQGSRGYRIMSRIVNRGIRISDSAIRAIQGNRHSWQDDPFKEWTPAESKRRLKRHAEEWEQSRIFYRQLKRKYAGKV